MNKKTRSIKSEKWRHTRTSVEIAWTNEQKSRFEVIVTSYGRNKNLDDEGQVLRIFKEFSFTKQKLDLEWTMSELRKPFKKIRSKKEKKTENQCQNAACEQKNH